MADLTLVIGNKNYSSWSLRPWLALRHAGLEFDEILIPLDEAGTRSEIMKHSGSGRLPALKEGTLTVWDSLAICEYVAELRPEAGLWPDARDARAVARAIACEMHSGFAALRQHMPMNIRSRFPDEGRKPGVKEDIDRIAALGRIRLVLISHRHADHTDGIDRLVAATGAPAGLDAQLSLLAEGAQSTAAIGADPEAAVHARRAAEVLIDAALAPA